MCTRHQAFSLVRQQAPACARWLRSRALASLACAFVHSLRLRALALLECARFTCVRSLRSLACARFARVRAFASLARVRSLRSLARVCSLRSLARRANDLLLSCLLAPLPPPCTRAPLPPPLPPQVRVVPTHDGHGRAAAPGERQLGPQDAALYGRRPEHAGPHHGPVHDLHVRDHGAAGDCTEPGNHGRALYAGTTPPCLGSDAQGPEACDAQGDAHRAEWHEAGD
jgi:hypothetical protein